MFFIPIFLSEVLCLWKPTKENVLNFTRLPEIQVEMLNR
jgi:hypothetical protein